MPVKALHLRQSPSHRDALSTIQKLEYMSLLSPRWELCSDQTRLSCVFKVDHFSRSFDHASRLARLAETENHHPVLRISFKSLECEIWTHEVSDLCEIDFIFAAKVDQIAQEYFL
jgi:4a-hydroxytetrahydrobiopterin dehydratase